MDAPYLQKKARTIAVLDVYVDGAGVEPAVLQMHLTRRLQELGWAGARTEAFRRAAASWKESDGAAVAKKKGLEAALVCSVRIAPPEPHVDPRADESTYSSPSDPTGNRREYYRKDESTGATHRGPEVRIEVAIVDAETAGVAYVAEYRTHLMDAEESALAEAVLRPLEKLE